MTKITRLLNLNCDSDRIQLSEIISEKDTLMRVSTDWKNKLEEKIQSFVNNERCRVFGHFHDDKLISFLSVISWKSLPYYTMSNYFVRPGSIRYFSIKNSGIPELFETSVTHMEKLGYYTFYYVRADERWPIKNKKRKNLGFDEHCKEYKKYIVTMEEIIYPGEESKYNTHRLMLGEQFDNSLKRVVIRYTLPNELRHWGYEFNEF